MTLASNVSVAEGVMEVRGAPGAFRGRLEAGGLSAEIVAVETAPGHMTVEADTGRGTVVLRLAVDAGFLSGNWVLGRRRGTVTAERRGRQSGVPTSTGRSSRPPHSDQEPS